MGRVISINPYNLFPELPHLKDRGWEPLRQPNRRSDDFAGDARCIADAIISKSAGGGNSKFFDISAENMLALFVMAECLKDKPDFNNIRLELSSPTLPQTLGRMAESDALPVRVAAGRLFTRLSDKNSQSTSVNDIIETVLKDMAFLDDPRLAFSMARGGAIDWSALHHREITTIYLILPVHELTGNGAKLLRLCVNLALRGLYQNPPIGGAALPRVLLLLEEFGSCLGRLEEVIKALGAARDYSIQLFMVLQSLSQLKAHYEKEWPLFFAGSGAVASFAPRDWDTAEALSKYYGQREEMVQTETNSGGSLTPQAVPLIRPEDLMRLPRGMTANLIEPCPWPVLAHCPVYPQTPFAAGLDANPYYRG
jgi:type IV secretion system protein VirD4